jgi:pentatricopeptide repeat protein
MELAMQVVLDMEANNVKPNVVTYSTLMDGYSKMEKYEALKLREKMKSLVIQMARIYYNTLLALYVKIGKSEQIAAACEEMEKFGIEKDTVTYNSLING